MAASGFVETLGPAVVLLGSAVVAVPLFRKLGLGSVLGYFTAGLIVGPSVLGLFSEPSTILHISELGVVMFLFLIGVEMRPQKLWALRAQIFGLGLAQVLLCTAFLTAAGTLLGLRPVVAFIAGAGFVLSSTAVVMSVLKERGETASPEGQKAVSILLLEDLMIVPLLALVAFIAASAGQGEKGLHLSGVLAGLGAIAIVIAAGRWLLDPFFALLARARTTEVLTAGALLIVLGSALLMELSGLSMAMGAFLAGVMLSGSSYRHQIETDIEPFKGLLMGLFFLAVGMSLDLSTVLANWTRILALLVAYILVKSIGIYAVARTFGGSNSQALRRVSLFAQGGEFAFVLYAAATGGGLLTAQENAVFSSVIILSMAITPLVLVAADRWLKDEPVSMEGVEPAHDLTGRVLMVGFGRFGQIASQLLLAQSLEISILDNDPGRVREARRFGFKVYFGDGSRLDVLRTSGAETADAILVCVNDRKATDHVVELVKEHFPMAKLLVRSYDRGHSIQLRNKGVDYDVRETFESAIAFGGASLQALGMTALEVSEVSADIRRRDCQRLELQAREGLAAGANMLHVSPSPEPLISRAGRKPADATAEDA